MERNIFFKLILVEVLFVGMLSCSNKTKYAKVSTIDLLECPQIDTFFIEDALNQKIIFLNGSDSCFVSNLNNVFIGDKIVLFDSGLNGRIFVCDSNGNNLKEVRIKGHGVGEIPFINSVYVDDKLYVQGGPQLNVYNLNDFSFEKKYQTMDVQCSDFIVIDSVMTSMYDFNFRDMFAELNSYSFKDGSSKKLMPFIEHINDRSKSGYCTGYLTRSSLGYLLFSRKFENIIYQVGNDTITERYKIKAYSGEQYIVPKEERTAENRSKYSIKKNFELNTNLYLDVLYSNDKNIPSNGLALFDKTSETTVFYRTLWSRKLRSRVYLIQSSGGSLVGCVLSHQLDYFKEKAKNILLDSCSSPEDLAWANLISTNVGAELNPVLLVLSEK